VPITLDILFKKSVFKKFEAQIGKHLRNC